MPERIPFVYDVIQKRRLVDTKIVFFIVEYLSRIHLGWSWIVHKYQRINTGPIFRHETDMARLCVNGSWWYSYVVPLARLFYYLKLPLIFQSPWLTFPQNKRKKKRKNRKRRRERNLWSRYAYRRTVCARMQVHTIITRHVYSSTADLAVLFRERCDGGDEDTANVYHEPGWPAVQHHVVDGRQTDTGQAGWRCVGVVFGVVVVGRIQRGRRRDGQQHTDKRLSAVFQHPDDK